MSTIVYDVNTHQSNPSKVEWTAWVAGSTHHPKSIVLRKPTHSSVKFRTASNAMQVKEVLERPGLSGMNGMVLKTFKDWASQSATSILKEWEAIEKKVLADNYEIFGIHISSAKAIALGAGDSFGIKDEMVSGALSVYGDWNPQIYKVVHGAKEYINWPKMPIDCNNIEGDERNWRNVSDSHIYVWRLKAWAVTRVFTLACDKKNTKLSEEEKYEVCKDMFVNEFEELEMYPSLCKSFLTYIHHWLRGMKSTWGFPVEAKIRLLLLTEVYIITLQDQILEEQKKIENAESLHIYNWLNDIEDGMGILYWEPFFDIGMEDLSDLKEMDAEIWQGVHEKLTMKGCTTYQKRKIVSDLRDRGCEVNEDWL